MEEKKFSWRSAVRIIAILVLIFALATLTKNKLRDRRSLQNAEDVRSLYYDSVPTDPKPEEETHADVIVDAEPVSEEVAEEVETRPIHEQFRKLYEENNDTVGWLKGGENVDFVVVQCEDNETYLELSFYFYPDPSGVLFVNASNRLFPESKRDDVFLIHGHKMVNGHMFGRLPLYKSYEYLCQYPLYTFRTIYDEEDTYYTPVAGFGGSMNEMHEDFFNLLRFNFEDDGEPVEGVDGKLHRQSKEYEEYLEEIKERSCWESKVDVSTDDKLMVLVSCDHSYSNGRFMLFLRPLHEDETPEIIETMYAEELEKLKAKK